MIGLNRKSKSTNTLIAGTIAFLFLLVRPTRTTVLLTGLALLLSKYATYLADMEERGWINIAWIWARFFLPILIVQMILLDWVVQFVPLRWVLGIGAIYFSIIPIIMVGAYYRLINVLSQIYT